MIKIYESSGNDLPIKKYSVSFSVDSKGKTYNLEFDISFSGDSSDYGNGYYMYAESTANSNDFHYIDCRYEKGLTSNGGFEKFIKKWIDSYWTNNNNDIVIEEV